MSTHKVITEAPGRGVHWPNQDYTIPSGTKGFVHYRCIGTSGWIITAAGTLP